MSDGPIGKRRWAIAEGWIPSASTGDGRAFESHAERRPPQDGVRRARRLNLSRDLRVAQF